MSLDELNDNYQLLRSELDAAYSEPVWDSNQINRITEEMIPVEFAIASCGFQPSSGGSSHA